MRHACRFALIVATGFLAGCEDLQDVGLGETYELVEANGQEVPAVVYDADTEFGHMVATAVSGSLTLRESTFTERVVFDITVDGTPFPGDPVVISGDYTADGPLLTFDPDRPGAATFTGTISGGILTTEEHDPQYGTLTLVWQR